MEACPNWHGGAGCPCDVLDLERPDVESDECPECSCHIEDHNAPEHGGGCTACGDCDAFVPEAPDHVDAIPFTMPAGSAAYHFERALRQVAAAMQRIDWEAFTHLGHRLVLQLPGIASDRAALSVARSCLVCWPDAGRARPAPLCIDGTAYRRRSKGRRR